MQILQISPFIPLPADVGGRIGIYGITRSLAERGHTIHFAGYRKETNAKWCEQLKKVSIPHIINVQTENSVKGALFNLFSPVPYNVSKFKSRELKVFIKDFFKNNRVDVVHIDHLHMGWIIDEIRKVSNVPVCLREHNLELVIMKRFSEQVKQPLLKIFSAIQYKKFLKYEPMLARKFDKVIMVSSQDELELKRLDSSIKTTVIPVGVDQLQFNYKKEELEPYSMFHIGPMDWHPNLDGLQWYLDDIFPDIIKKIPQLKFYIYGKDTNRLRISDNVKNNVIVAGYVKDIWAETLNKMLLVIPLRIGGGIRVKIIEMLATGQNIISTSVGKEGIDVQDGKSIIVADSKEEFVNKTAAYFNNEYDHNHISKNAKELIAKKYTWRKIAEDFENTYLEVIKNTI